MRTNDQERAEFLNQWKESGLSQKQFCSRIGIPYSTFMAWRKKEKRELSCPADRIVPVTVMKEDTLTEQPRIILSFGFYQLDIRPGFPESELKKIIEMLAS